MKHSGVHDFQFHSGRASQRVDGRSATQIIHHHLRRYRLRKWVDPLGANAVIGSKHHDSRLRHRWRERGLNGRHAVGDLFETPQAARRFGQLQLPRTGLLDPTRVHRLNPFDCLFHESCCHILSPNTLARASNRREFSSSVRTAMRRYRPGSSPSKESQPRTRMACCRISCSRISDAPTPFGISKRMKFAAGGSGLQPKRSSASTRGPRARRLFSSVARMYCSSPRAAVSALSARVVTGHAES